MKNSIALVVLSCDRYFELWSPLIQSFSVNWPDCPYDKFIVTNYKKVDTDEFTLIQVGEDLSWSRNLLNALNVLEGRFTHVLITLDDLFLSKKVDTFYLNAMVQSFLHIDGNYLKLLQGPKHTKRINEFFGEIEPGSLYRPTCVFALWKVSTLKELIVPEENAWEFERNGALRSNKFDKFFVTYKDLIFYRNTVVRGKILPADARKYNLENVKSLGVMTAQENRYFLLRYYIFKVTMKIIPWKLQRKALIVKNFILNKKV